MKRTIFIGLAFAACSKSEAPPAGAAAVPPVPVSVAEVAVRDVALYFEEKGTIAPQQTAEVKPYVSGLITGVYFHEGERVEEGELLYTIEKAPYEIKVREAAAQLAQTQANLDNALKKLERYRSLSKQDLIAKVEWDELETRVALSSAIIKADEARLAAAQLDLAHCDVLAPIAGQAGKSNLSAGNRADSGMTLVTLSQNETLFVEFNLTERELEQLPVSFPSLEIYAAGSEEKLGEGVVTFLDHTIDPKSGMLAARGRLTIKNKQLYAGQSVRVHLFFSKKEQAQLIPLRAIKTNQSGAYVFAVKEDNTVEIRPIRLGREEKGMIIVESGLDQVSRVVTEGQLRLFPGSKVEEVR